MKYFVLFLFVLFVGNLTGQTNATNTPSIQALTKLARLNEQSSFLTTLNTPDLLLQTKEKADAPNYEGNAFAVIRRSIWLRLIKGEPVLED
jgi:hypothetical protein